MLCAVLRGSVLAAGTSSGRISLLDIVSGEQLRAVRAHDKAVIALNAEQVERLEQVGESMGPHTKFFCFVNP